MKPSCPHVIAARAQRRRPRLGLAAAVVAVIGTLAVVGTDSVSATPAPWTVLDLGTPAGATSRAVAINASGQVTGSILVGGTEHAFRWTAGGGIEDLGTLPGDNTSIAAGINASGQVVGTSQLSGGEEGPSGPKHAFLWTPGVGMVNLGNLGGTLTSASYSAVGINDAGAVYGHVGLPGPGNNSRPWVWQAPGPMVNLGTLPTTNAFNFVTAMPSAMNASGQVVGSSTAGAWTGGYHAFSWSPPGPMADPLGASSVEAKLGAFAHAVNDSGVIAGSSAQRAFVWSPVSGYTDIGSFGGAGYLADAQFVNASGTVAGVSQSIDADGYHGFSWVSPGPMVDIGVVGNGNVTGLNAAGLVVGYSQRVAVGFPPREAFAWAPGGTMTLLPKLGGQESVAVGVNDAGQVAGYAGTADGFHAVVWSSAPVDTTAPVVTVPGDQTVEATSASGASVMFTPAPSASDPDDAAGPVVCAPASGSQFALGSTTVTCSSSDTYGNTGTASFRVTVRDTGPPTVVVPANITVAAGGPGGATVTYDASASDVVDGPVPVSCAPASGSVFAPGTTTVRCTANDAHSNVGSAEFSVTVGSTTTARSLVQDALAGANALLAGSASKSDTARLRDVVKKLTDGADASSWLDGDHLAAKGGEQVIDQQKDAAHKLAELLKKSDIPDASLRALIDDLTQSVGIVASKAIDAAVAGGGGASKIAQARSEAEKADEALAKGKLEEAFDHWKNAWKKAGESLK